MHKMYVRSIIEKSSKEDMEKLEEMFDKAVDHLKECDHELYKDMEMELYEIVNGKKISLEMAEKWVQNMIPAHQHFTIEETTNAMRQYGYNCDQVDFYVVANMIFNDFYDVVKDNDELTYRLAYDWLNDKDAVDDKLYCYWKYIVSK